MLKRQNVTIKGTKDGLTLHLDDMCSYEDLKSELADKVFADKRHARDRHMLEVRVQVGNRFLTKEQQDEIKSIILKKKDLSVVAIESNVMLREEAEKLRESEGVTKVARIIRSGQVLEVPGDLLLIGDVNPGGMVMAGGNIFVMGVLKGIAHAGCYGNRKAVITASSMKPSQLRISDSLNRAPDHTEDEGNREMECAYIDENHHITVDRLQALVQLRPELTRLEGGR